MGSITVAMEVVGILRLWEGWKVIGEYHARIRVGWEAGVTSRFPVGEAPSSGVAKIAGNLLEQLIVEIIRAGSKGGSGHSTVGNIRTTSDVGI